VSSLKPRNDTGGKNRKRESDFGSWTSGQRGGGKGGRLVRTTREKKIVDRSMLLGTRDGKKKNRERYEKTNQALDA